MQFSAKESELYTEFSTPQDTSRETVYTHAGWPVRYAEHPTGRYHTLSAGDITVLSGGERSRLSRAAACILGEYLTDARCVLVCGLGNERITPDRLGWETCRRLTIPSPLPNGRPDGRTDVRTAGRNFYCFCPGVSAATGLPTDTLVGMTAECIRADRILAVDALCARSAASLSSVLQITDTGLTPGSGADPTGGFPPEISTRTMPCPVVTAGVPTVIRTALPDGGDTRYLVTSGDADRVIDCWSAVLAAAILRVMLRPEDLPPRSTSGK